MRNSWNRKHFRNILHCNFFHLTFVSCKLGSHVSTVQSDESSFVSHGVTVVRRGEHGDTLPIVSHLVSIILKNNDNFSLYLKTYS